MYSIDLSIFYSLFNLSGQAQWSDWLIVALAEYLPYLIMIAVAVAVFRAWQRELKSNVTGYILAIVSGGISRGIVELIRFFYHHPRPPVALGITSLFPETSYSFPSGHAVFFFGLAMGVYFINKRFGILLFILSIFIGLARISAGVHWPSDILGGAVLGILVSIVIFKLWNQSYNKKKE